MKRTATIAAGALALAAAGVLSAGILFPSSAMSGSVRIAAAEQTTVFAIKNMTCALCPITVRAAMERVKGVKSVKVNFGAKTATAIYDPSIATAGTIAKASTDAGYPATPARKGG